MKNKTNEWWQILWSLAVLIATLAFIYTIFYGVEKPTPSAANADGFSKNEQTIVIQPLTFEGLENESFEEWQFIAWNPPEEEKQNTIQEESLIQEPSQDIENKLQEEQGLLWAETSGGKTFFSVQDLFSDVQVNEDGIVPLSWTFLREWNLRSLVDLELLWEEKYVLKTIENAHFAYLWSFDNKSIPWIAWLWWNIVEINDKNNIQWHGLFWDRIRFINTERYKAFDKVLFIVFFDVTSDAWFVQMDHDHYYSAKSAKNSVGDRVVVPLLLFEPHLSFFL